MTIYEALARKLGRKPTNVELKTEIKRIIQEAIIEQAEKGKLLHQKKS